MEVIKLNTFCFSIPYAVAEKGISLKYMKSAW